MNPNRRHRCSIRPRWMSGPRWTAFHCISRSIVARRRADVSAVARQCETTTARRVWNWNQIVTATT